jgi:hypothetical protein
MKRFLTGLLERSLAFSLRGNSSVAFGEPLSRFVTTKRWVDRTRQKPRAREQAFLPRADGETSVYRRKLLSDRRHLRIGRLIAAGGHDGTLYGFATTNRYYVEGAGLRLDVGGRFSSHRNIIGWPSGADKDRQKVIALLLARDAVFESA